MRRKEFGKIGNFGKRGRVFKRGKFFGKRICVWSRRRKKRKMRKFFGEGKYMALE